MLLKRICVIIVTYNGMKWIDRCMSDLSNSTMAVDTVVVDNGSTDSTLDFIKNNYPEVMVFKMDHNLGFGQANNYGIKYALKCGYEFIFLLNQDAYVYSDMFENLISAVENANVDNIGIVSPMQLHPNGKWLEAHFEAYVKRSMPIEKLSGEGCFVVDGVQAAGWLIPRNTLEIIGGFNPLFFHYGEDENYFQRVVYHGLKTVVVPSAKMIHDHVDYGKRKLENTDKIFRMLKSQSFLNINKSPLSIIGDCVVCLCRGTYHSLKYYRIKHLNDSIMAIVRNIMSCREYSSNRDLAKKQASTWLINN